MSIRNPNPSSSSVARTLGDTTLWNFFVYNQMENRNPSCIGVVLSFRGPFPGLEESHVRRFTSSYEIARSLFAQRDREDPTNRLLHRTIHDPRCDSTDVTIGAFTSTRSEIKCLFCLFCLFHRAHRHYSHGVSRINWRWSDRTKIHRSSQYVCGFMILPLFRYFFF